MVTSHQMRKLALSLPEAEEKSHFGQPDFRVRGKIFAGLNPEGTRGTLKLVPELQAMLLDSRPKAFQPAAGYWGRQGWTHVVLEHVELGALRELLQEAWRSIAPKRLLVSAKNAASGATQGSSKDVVSGSARPRAAKAAKKSGSKRKKRASSSPA